MAFPSPFDTPSIRLVEIRLVRGLARGDRITCPRESARIVAKLIGDCDREHFAALYLDGRHAVTHVHVLSVGTTQGALVHPREVFKGAFLANAAALIIGHNHPSGDVTPSSEDHAVTSRLRQVGELLGIKLLDSLVVGPSTSFYAESVSSISSWSRDRTMQVSEGARYFCPECGSADVELCFPVWVPATAIDNRERWELDVEAQPEKDGDKGWCPHCGTNVLVRKEECDGS